SREYDLTPYAHIDLNRVMGVFERKDTDTGPYDVDYTKEGRWAEIRDNEGRRTLVLSSAPIVGNSIVVQVQRLPDPVYQETDIIPVSERVAAAAASVAMFRFLNRQPGTAGKFSAELGAALAEFERVY